VLVLLRGPGNYEMRAEVGKPSADGMVFVRLTTGGTFIPFRRTGYTSDDDLPVFEYAIVNLARDLTPRRGVGDPVGARGPHWK
jgi:hypothetical protein